jgi:hypothetical protein
VGIKEKQRETIGAGHRPVEAPHDEYDDDGDHNPDGGGVVCVLLQSRVERC